MRGPDAGDPCADDEDVDVTSVLDLLGVLGGSGGRRSRPGWTSGTRALMSIILAPTLREQLVDL
jgi:hypothetical protein